MATDLVPYLESIGLRVRRIRGDEIEAWCPAHAIRVGHEDMNPSFGFNQAKQVGHCLSCGYSPTFGELVELLTGNPPTWDMQMEVKAASIEAKIRPSTEAKQAALSIHPWMLTQLREVPERLLAIRHLTAEAARAFNLRWDDDRHCWVIPVYDPGGTLAWVQLRQKGAVKNEPEGTVKSDFLYNLNNVLNRESVALVESPLDAVRLGAAGIPAVSSFGAHVSDRQIRLLSLHFTRVVLALDNDGPGVNATGFVAKALRKTKTAVHPWRYDSPGWERWWKDPGDCSSDDMLRNVWNRTLRCGL